MATRNAQTKWTGTLEAGKGRTELLSSGLPGFDVDFPRRAADDAGGVTSPEELIAAAHSACFAMQFSAELGERGGTAREVTVSASATLGPDPAGGFRISRINLVVTGAADGVTSAQFEEAANAAKANCPVSKALAGVERITLSVTPTF